MLGLALEGGGARGSYHIGAFKAFLENSFEFDGFVGTSIGAVNAAALAQDDFEAAYDLWTCVSMENLFDADLELLTEIGNLKLTKNFLNNVSQSLKKVIKDGGIDTSKMREIISSVIDEKKLRNSKKDYGLVTISATELKAHELFIEDIPQGELINYIMASASFPGLKPEVINECTFTDGGLYNNCPINLLSTKKYDEIYAIRTFAPGRFKNIKHNNLTIIEPKEDLGHVMIFENKQIMRNIDIGYLDTLSVIKDFKGRNFYIKDYLSGSENILMNISDEALKNTANHLHLKEIPGKRLLFELIIPQLAGFLKLKKNYSYSDFLIAMLEYWAAETDIFKYKIYTADEFFRKVRASFYSSSETHLNFPGIALKSLTNKNWIAIKTLLDDILN